MDRYFWQMSERSSLMESFIPNFVKQQSVVQKLKDLQNYTEKRESVVFFLDISGFSKLAGKRKESFFFFILIDSFCQFVLVYSLDRMSSMFAKEHGKGEEELTRVLNSYFSKLLMIIRKHEGNKITFLNTKKTTK
jgi:hypothetical protein